jgi:hypothetical protein
MIRFLMALFVAVVASFPAAAGGNTSFHFGVSSGHGHRHHGHHHWRHHHHHHRHWGHHHYRPRSTVFLYSGPSYYYVPPPRVIYYDPYPVPIARPTGQCTVFNGDAVIDGSGQPFYGRACIFTDGRWHIVP